MPEKTCVPEEERHAAAETPELSASEEEAEARRAEFERLIRGEYKEEFEQRVQKIIDRRFREMRGMKEQAARVKPVMDALYQKYGDTDTEALAQKLLSNEGEMRGMRAAQTIMAWERAAEELSQTYPDFNVKNEMQNPDFVRLLRAGVDMKTAYHALHQDELIENAVRYAASTARDRTETAMRKLSLRPQENGLDGRGGARMSPMNVNNMTRQEREEIERRSARGEKVYF